MELTEAKLISNLSKEATELYTRKKGLEMLLRKMMDVETTMNCVDITIDFDGESKPLMVPTGDAYQDSFLQYRINTDETMMFSHREMMEFLGLMLRSTSNKIKGIEERIKRQ